MIYNYNSIDGIGYRVYNIIQIINNSNETSPTCVKFGQESNTIISII